MNALLYLASLAASAFVFEALDGLLTRSPQPGRLAGVAAGPEETPPRRPSAWHAVLIALLPTYFHPGRAAVRRDVVDLIRRAGYPYATTGEFFAAALRTFSLFLLAGGALAGVMTAVHAGPAAAVGVAAVFIILGLRRPYSRLHRLAKKRAAAVRSNMLSGLAILNALISAGVGVQESLRRSAAIGGPFCNLLGLLVAQMEVASFHKAVDVVEDHLPEPEDIEARLFLRAVRDFYGRNRPLQPAIEGLQRSVQREVLEATETRAALVRQRSGLFGVLAVLGLVITIIAPFLGVFTS